MARFGHCPVPAALSLAPVGRALVIAPHADDETLGCGGTLARMAAAGWQVRVLVVTDGAAGDPLHFVEDVVATRQRECRAALARLGVSDVRFLDEPDGRFRGHRGFDAVLATALAEFRPDWLLSPSPLDYHRDHVAIALSVVRAWRRRGGAGRLFYYETWVPLPVTHVVDIGAVMDRKFAAVAEYVLPQRYARYLESARGLAAYRGLFLPQAEGLVGAEGFVEEDRAGLWATLIRLRRLLERKLKP